MDNIDNVEVHQGQYFVMIIVNEKTIDANTLKWHEENYEEFGERYITLGEIYRQLLKKGYTGTIYVWEETPLEGTIYQCGNYEQGQWMEHGKTKGYA